MIPIAAIALLAAAPVTVDQVKWLAGCWESAAPERGVEEQWLARQSTIDALEAARGG